MPAAAAVAVKETKRQRVQKVNLLRCTAHKTRRVARREPSLNTCLSFSHTPKLRSHTHRMHTTQASSTRRSRVVPRERKGRMAAVAVKMSFWDMNEAELRQWVEANPGRVNRMDRWGFTPLYVAVCRLKNLSLTVWLLDEKGADVKARTKDGESPLHEARSLDILTALLDRGADPIMLYNDCVPSHDPGDLWTIRQREAPAARPPCPSLYRHARPTWRHSTPFCLPQPQRNKYTCHGPSPPRSGRGPYLYQQRRTHAFDSVAPPITPPSPSLNKPWPTPRRPRSLSRLAGSPSPLGATSWRHPACRTGAQGQPLPGVALQPVPGGQADGEDEDEVEARKFRTMLDFLLGMGGGPKGDGMPRDVFRAVLDLLMPAWDPLRKRGGAGLPLQG